MPRTTTPADRAANPPTVDWGEDDDLDDDDLEALAAIEAEFFRRRISGEAIDVDGTKRKNEEERKRKNPGARQMPITKFFKRVQSPEKTP